MPPTDHTRVQTYASDLQHVQRLSAATLSDTMARRHSNSDYIGVREHPHHDQDPHDDEWWPNPSRAHHHHIVPDYGGYNPGVGAPDRRVSAPEYLFASTGGFNIATSDGQPTYSSTGSHYVLEKPEVRPAGYPDLSQWQPNSAELQPHFRRLHRASINYRAQNVNLVAARRDHSHTSLYAHAIPRPTTYLQNGHPARINVMRGLHSQRTTSIRTDHLDDPQDISEHVHRHDDVDDGMAETHAVIHHSLSPDSEVSPPRLGSASSSSLKRPATLGPASDALRRQALEHRPIEEPGIPADNIHPYVHVLVPTGHNDRDGASRSPDDARHLAEKKPIPARKGYRKPMDESERQAIKQNRKYGVCLRCKLFKERCRGGIPCERCRSLKVWKSICVPAQFTEKAVFNRDIYGGRLGLLYATIDSWASDHQLKYGMPESSSRFDISGFGLDNGPKEVDVSNGYPPVLRVKAHPFVPIDRVLLEHILWRAPGKPGYNRLPSTSYGLKEEIPSDALDDYIDSNLVYIIEDMKNGRAGTDPCIEMHIDTIEAAYEYANSNKDLSLLVRQALRIWTAQNFFFNNAWRICSAETLEMSKIDNPESKLHGVIPLPRLMNQQLDYYIENRVANLEKELLAELQARILDRNPNEWFGIFLAIYIHLCSIERDNWCLSTWNHDKDILIERVQQLEISSHSQKLKRGPEKAYIWPVAMCPSELIKKNEHLADMLVSHFRTISRGYVPFTLDWDQKQVVQMAGNEREAVDYMKSMSTHVSKFERNLLARLSAKYSREDAASLDGMYTSKLMLSDE